jgi:hypothetical protein
MKHVKSFNTVFESWDEGNQGQPNPWYGVEPEYDVEYKPEQQLFVPVFIPFAGNADPDSEFEFRRHGNAEPDYDVLMDKTTERAIWMCSRGDDDDIPQKYKAIYIPRYGEQDRHESVDVNTVLNFCTDEFKAGHYYDSMDAWEQDDYKFALCKISTTDEVEQILNDFYRYLSPGHGSYYGKARKPKAGYNANRFTLSAFHISEIKSVIRTLLKYKERIGSNTVGGSIST